MDEATGDGTYPGVKEENGYDMGNGSFNEFLGSVHSQEIGRFVNISFK